MLDELPEGAVSLGGSVGGEPVHYTKVVATVDGKEEWVGIHVWHKCLDRDQVMRWDAGYVAFDHPTRTRPPTWTVNSYDPLDLSPSVLQPDCGFHGFIREGKWVPA